MINIRKKKSILADNRNQMIHPHISNFILGIEVKRLSFFDLIQITADENSTVVRIPLLFAFLIDFQLKIHPIQAN